MQTYSNLSTRSHYSCGLGIGTSKELIKQAKELNLNGFAITDRFTAAGLLDFYFASKKEEFPVALGTEIYYFDGMNKTNRIIVIAKNQNGYNSICRLITYSWKNAESYKIPCVSLYDLQENSRDLYCLSSHLKSKADLLPIFKENLVYEIILDSKHNPQDNKDIFDSGESFVITSDAYMPTKEHKILQDIMIINNSRGLSNEPFVDVKPLMSSKDIVSSIITSHPYMKDPVKLKSAFDLSNSIMKECSKIELKFKDQVVNYPHLMHPLNYDGCSKTDLVWRIIKEYQRLPDLQEYIDRLEYELDAIQNNGRIDLIDYFLVLEDVCRFCRDNDIAVGPGRGSGAGSLVNYCLKITHLDPIEDTLLFERFISKGRIQKGTLPDIDLDFSEPERVREYLRDLYGSDRVIRIGTFQTLKVLGSIKDIMKAIHPEVDFQTVNRVTGSFGKKDQEETELEFFERNMQDNDKAKVFFKQYPKAHNLVEKLLGYNRQSGGHPCFSGEMKILTENGYKSFSDLSGSIQKIITPSGWRYASFYTNGIKKTYKQTLTKHSINGISPGISIRSTVDHLFKMIDDSNFPLSKGSILSNNNYSLFDDDFVLLGWAWNDGYYCNSLQEYIICITPGKDEEFKNQYQHYFIDLIKKYKYKINLELKNKFDELGYDKEKTKCKSFPSQWHQWTTNQKYSWLRGMFSANGFVLSTCGNVGIKLKSKELIESMRIALNELGFSTTALFNDQASGWSKENSFYFYFDKLGAASFLKVIGFIQTYKQNILINKHSYRMKSLPTQPIVCDVYDFTVEDGEPYGLVEGFWAHNCGLAITQDPIENFAPLRSNKGEWFLELTANDCEKSGIIKYDILGLKTMKYISSCLKLCGIDDLYSIPLNDEKTFVAFSIGDTTSVFQFNSDVSKGILTQLPIEKYNLDVLCMTTAAGRPGPMGNGIHVEFFRRVQGKIKSIAPHPALAAELKATYGLMIYQESVMKASEILGGFSLVEADDIRKAMGKKIASVLAPYKDRFLNHCYQKFPETAEDYISEEVNPVKQTKAEYIWNLMATFSGYGFNKSHSMAYARIGYYCQYLKVNYPLQWWTACMMHADSDQLREYYQACSELTLNPDINLATSDFFINDAGKIQMPFSCLKGLGPKASEEIVKCRPYSSFKDFFDRVNKTRVNKAVVEKLIFSGSFDTFNTNMQELIDQYYSFRGEKTPDQYKVLTKSKIAEMRAKGLSFLSMDYYKIYPHLFPENEMTYLDKLVISKNKVFIGGIVTKVIMKKTKTQKDFCNLIISNDGEDVECRLWSEELELYSSCLEVGKILKLSCNTSEYNSKLQLTVTNIEQLIKD